MILAITGGTGLVGRFLVEDALQAGDEVVNLSRNAPPDGFFSGPVRHLSYDLSGPAPDLTGFDAVIHAGFAHVPGRYRGGEGEDAAGFRASNLDGSLRLLDAARGRFIFLSSRAVYGPCPRGVMPSEDHPCAPDTLYGALKLEFEGAVTQAGGTSLRATGVYGPPGPGQAHKWAGLFADFDAGRTVASRAATELHGADLAAAARLCLAGGPALLNVSDMVLDHRDLLAEYARLTGRDGVLPERADAGAVSAMDTTRLRDMGWQGRGMDGLRDTLAAIVTEGAGWQR